MIINNIHKRNQNRFAIVVALLITLFVVTMLISGIASAREVTLLEKINSVRSKPLTQDKHLDKLAMERCVKMTEFSHNEFWLDYNWRILKRGYQYRGENLFGVVSSNGETPIEEDAFQFFQYSPTHQANNINDRYTKVGIAICNNKVLGTVVVVEFAGKKNNKINLWKE